MLHAFFIVELQKVVHAVTRKSTCFLKVCNNNDAWIVTVEEWNDFSRTFVQHICNDSTSLSHSHRQLRPRGNIASAERNPVAPSVGCASEAAYPGSGESYRVLISFFVSLESIIKLSMAKTNNTKTLDALTFIHGQCDRMRLNNDIEFVNHMWTDKTVPFSMASIHPQNNISRISVPFMFFYAILLSLPNWFVNIW